ncbi:MAG: DUF1361 domain-containing protein [Armatimonadota bacterium]
MASLIGNVAWNTMLALIPVGLACAALRVSRWTLRPWVRAVLIAALAAAWLVFLPNTCYLLTEWRHFLFKLDAQDLFVRSRTQPYLLAQIIGWSVFYFLYSGFGMLMFAVAIRPMEYLADRNGAALWFWRLPLFVALSVGVYLGLVVRLNTWDIVSRPATVWQSIVQIGGHPLLAAFIIAFGVFLWLAYESLDIWIEGLAHRRGKAASDRDSSGTCRLLR